MALKWDQVQTEFAGDETTNFGPREETGTALYQVDTIATISAENETAGKVQNLVSAALGELVTVAVDHHLSIFKESEHVTTIEFENLVEDCAWSPDGALLLVVDSGGKTHLIDVDSMQFVFVCKLVQGSKPGERAFHRITVRSGEEMHTCDLVLLSATGLLFVVKDFSSSAFGQGEGDLANVMEQFRKVDTSEVHTNVTWDAVPMGGGSVMTVGGGDNILAVWTWMDDRIALGDCISDILEAECAIIGAKLASNGNLLYCLDKRNQISVWAVPQFVMLSIVNLNIGTERSIRDFLHLETQGMQTNSQEGACLVLLLNDLLSTTLQIRNLESGTDVYTLQLGASTSLSKCVTTQESLYVAEGTTVPWEPTEVSTVRLRCLTETEPKTRLQRILHKKRFEEALQFAKLFHLDTELVYTAQMNQLLEQLSPWNVVCYDDKQVSSMLEQLWTSIHNVKDSELVAENCMRVALPSLSDTEKLLQMCQTKMQTDAMNESERRQSLTTKVLGLQNRLMTFKLVYGSNSYSADSWIRFQQANLLHLVCRDMTQHQPHNTVLVWRRHCEEWRDQMTVEIVRQYLQVVAEQLPADSVLKWLKDLLPYLATILPEAVEEVIKWALQRACRMEEEEKSGWPHNAVDFLETLGRGVTTMTDVNFTATNDTPVEMAMKSQIDVHSMLSPVRSALTQLHQLQHLLTYDLRLSMKQLQQETTETLAYRMLDQVVMIDLIKPTLEKYITPYIRAHCLDQDNIFATYIKDLLERLGDVRSYTGQSAWEDKVLAIMSFINNPKEKCCAVLNVIRHAPLPWSPDIQKLVEEGFKIRHPLVQELKEAKKIADIRLLMQEYGLKGRAVPDQKRAERLAMHIVEQDKPNSLADTLRVLKEYNISTLKTRREIFLRYSNRLIINDRVIEYMQVLRSLDVSEAQRLVEGVVSLAEICLDEDPPEPMVKKVIDEHKKHMTMAAVLSLLYILPKTTDRFEVDELNIQLETFSGLLALQREYQMILPVSEYREEKNRRRIFALFTQRYLEENTPFQGSGKLTVLYRLADLLQLQREAIQGDLAVAQGRAGNWNAVFFLCRELLKAEDSAQAGQIFSRVVRELLQLQGQGCFDGGDDGDQAASQSQHLPVILEKLADRAVVMCDAKSLASCLEVSKSARLWRKVCSQCEVTDTALLQLEPMEVKSASEGPLQMHSLDTLYSDEALILNSSIALPIAAASLDATLAFQKNEEGRNAEDTQGASVQNVSAHFQPIISHLKENDHLQLSLHFLIHTTSSLRQSLLKHDMGFPLSPQVKSWLDEQRTEMQGTEKRSVQLFNSLTSSLALKVLSARHVDHQMALAYLLSAPRKVGVDCLMKSIASCNFNFRRLGVIANVGQALGHLLKEAKLISTCQELETNAAWGVRLGKLKISFKKAFQGGLSDKHDVIASMARCEKVDIRMVAEFSEDFKMDVEDSQLVFLEELLKTSQAPWQLDRARTVVSAVEAQDPLLNKLKTIYKQTSPYEYEVIEFLFGEMNRLDPSPLYEKGLKLVSYLKMYTRRNPPSDEELNSASVVQENLEECGDAGDKLPQLSAQRVPLHPLLEAERWKVITPELDGESVPQWLQIAQLLEIPADEVCVIAVQNIVRRHVSNLSSPSSRSPAGSTATDKGKAESLRSWQVSETSLQTQEQVQQLLLRVKSCEMALACANWVVRELPMGGDRALALRGCVEFARRWYTICDDNTPQQEKAQAALSKFQKVLRKVQTVQALHQSNLAEPQLTKLTSSPAELIESLTEHSAVIAEGTEPAPDVFNTVQKVCEVNDLDIGQVLVTGMRKWLLASDSAIDMDTTMNLSFSNLKMTKEEVECSQHDNIKRVLYFLHRAPRPLALKFLISTIENGTEEGTSHLGRMNCLYCLLQIGDNADLQPVGLSYQSLREMLRVSCYLTQLEELHIQHSVQTLNDCNKMGLVKAIWRNHKHQKSAVKLSAALCLDYKLYDRQQWAVMLQQMINLQMLLELEHVLRRLHSVPALWSLPVFVSAWQAVLITELRRASLPLSDEQTRSCLHSFNLLESMAAKTDVAHFLCGTFLKNLHEKKSCPVLSQVDLCAMKQQFLNLELDVCAAACLLMDLSASPTDVKELLNQDPAKFIEQSYSLTALGMSLPSAKKVREVLFQLVLEQGDYHLISQRASQDFAHFIILWDDIDGCLQFGLSSNMFSQANKLLELYCQYYPEKYDEVVAWCEYSGFQMDSILEGYVHMKKLA